jgi:hypothetical protein
MQAVDFVSLPHSRPSFKENSADQIAIQCSEGSPGTERHLKKGPLEYVGESMIRNRPPVEEVTSLIRLKDFVITTRGSTICNQYPRAERIFSEFI